MNTENNTQEDPTRPDLIYIESFEPDAWDYMNSLSIPGAEEPINYLPPKLPVKFACEVLARSITLTEAQCLVVPDGRFRKCKTTGEKFQPVKYLAEISPELAQLIINGQPLTRMALSYNGCYAVDPILGIRALAGGHYIYDEESQDFVANRSSELYNASIGGYVDTGKMAWGFTLNDAQIIWDNLQAERREEKRRSRHEFSQKVSAKFSGLWHRFLRAPTAPRSDFTDNLK